MLFFVIIGVVFMKRFLLLFIIIVLGTSALASKYYVDDQTHEFYKRELLNRGWLYGCAPFNTSLTEPVRGIWICYT